jgi:hypothetical protein
VGITISIGNKCQIKVLIAAMARTKCTFINTSNQCRNMHCDMKRIKVKVVATYHSIRLLQRSNRKLTTKPETNLECEIMVRVACRSPWIIATLPIQW